MSLNWDELDSEIRQALGEHSGLLLDRARIEAFASGIATGRLSADKNRLAEAPEPVGSDVVDELDAFSAEVRERYEAGGRHALARGQIAAVVLNGGMATRFGGVVKGTVEAFGGRSFLELKLAQVRQHGPVPFLVMNSFATHAHTSRFLESKGLVDEVLPFIQRVSLRLTPRGQLFRDSAAAISLYAPGHGDFCEVLADSGRLAELKQRGVSALMLSNVDNLGAELDPLIVGYHLAHGRPLTVELARSVPGDVGGAPARVAGRVQVVEGFRFPAGFEFDSLPFMNTNTFMISLAALERTYPLSWFYVEKTVDDMKAVQIERLVGELSAFVDAAYLAAPRGGSQGRFFPVKSPEDLEALRRDPVLVERFGSV